jgi:transcription elongation factor GreA
MSAINVLSKAVHAKLTAEFEDLTTRGRIEIAQAIERAREMGDLSENGDYHAAKDQQGMMEGRIRQLQSILQDAEISDSAHADVVGPGSIVTINYVGDDDSERYLVGHIEELSDTLAVITIGSPLGAALLGHRTGDTVSYEAHGTQLQVVVKAIEI